MIVTELSPGAIASAIRHGEFKSLAERRKAVERYMGVGLESDVRRYFDPRLLDQVPVDAQRIAAKVIDRRYSVYQESPDRSSDNEDYASLQGNLPLVQSHLERLTGLLGTMACIVTVDGLQSPEGAAPTALHYVPLIEFEPIFLPDDPEPFGLAYPLHDAAAKDSRERRWQVWTDKLVFRVGGDGGMEPLAGLDDFANPFGAVPVFYSHREPQTGDWMRPIAHDALSTQLVYNVLGVLGNAGALFQALGQEVIVGVTDARDVQRGPSKALILPPGADYRMEAPPGGLASIAEWQRWKVDTLAASYGLKIKWADASGGATSGEHQRILEIELTSQILADFARWRHVEDERHRVARVVAEYYGLGDLGETVVVNFSDPNIPLSDADKRERWLFEYEHGLASLQDYWRIWDSDMDEQQLAERLQRTADERAQFAGPAGAGAPQGPSLADLFAQGQ